MGRILFPGNDRGFVLLDAVISLFLTGLILLAAGKSVTTIIRVSAGAVEREAALLEERNKLGEARYAAE
jgi:Tfp pilus assembly protein PilX